MSECLQHPRTAASSVILLIYSFVTSQDAFSLYVDPSLPLAVVLVDVVQRYTEGDHHQLLLFLSYKYQLHQQEECLANIHIVRHPQEEQSV